MIFLGADPGSSGGLAAISPRGVVVTSMPETETDVWQWFKQQLAGIPADESLQVFATIEQVGGFIKGNPAPGSAMFKFGASYGGLRMALIAADIPFEAVTPQRWQKGLGVSARDKQETKTQFKGRLRAAAQRLFPGVKVTLAVADSLLIATYCQRKIEGRLG